jgi:hypothetical protein
MRNFRAALPILGLVGGLGAFVVASTLLAAPTVRDLLVHLRADRALQALPFELAVGLMAVGALATCAVWLALVVTATAFEAATGLSSRLVRAATPRLVRRTVLTAVTVALWGTAAVAPAAAAPQDGEPIGGQTAVDLGPATALVGLPLPDRATGTPRPAGPPRTIAVARGDSLWSLAETLLPPDAGAARVGGTWRELYRFNRAVVGPDPHHLEVGTVLRVPTSLMPVSPTVPGDTTDPLTRKDAP